MGKLEELDRLQKLKESGTLTVEEFEKEKAKILNKKGNRKKIAIIVMAILVAIFIIIGVILGIRINSGRNINEQISTNSNDIKETSSNIQAGYVDNISFGNYNSSDKNFSETQKRIIDYYNNNYMQFSSSISQKYPQMFKGAKVCTYVRVVKVLNSTDSEFEIIAADLSTDGWKAHYETIDQIPNGNIMYIKGKQLNERLTGGEKIYVYGKYEDVESKEIDGKSYMVSKVIADFIQGFHYDKTERYELLDAKYSFDVIKDIAEYIFGKDIKISKDSGEYGEEVNYYNVVLDDQSNLNFKSFNMYDDQGMIIYDYEDNNLKMNIQKRLFISADFQNYIVTTYDENTEHVYIDYYDKSRTKIWSREFDYKSTKAYISPMDYNNDTLACVVDNDLYIIDLKTGKDKIDSTIVGEKVRVLMLSDGILLIGDNSKDTIMKIDYSGKILYKKNIEFEGDLERINYSYVQLINDKLSIYLDASLKTYENVKKYILMDKDGNIESKSNDIKYEF